MLLGDYQGEHAKTAQYEVPILDDNLGLGKLGCLLNDYLNHWLIVKALLESLGLVLADEFPDK